MLWQDWWENGDLKPGVYDTSGESLGMNHAAYIKLRGAWVRMAPPIPTVKWVTIGSTDYSMWNEWTIGKARYIDRDNGSGVFVEGEVAPERAAQLHHRRHGAAQALGRPGLADRPLRQRPAGLPLRHRLGLRRSSWRAGPPTTSASS